MGRMADSFLGNYWGRPDFFLAHAQVVIRPDWRKVFVMNSISYLAVAMMVVLLVVVLFAALTGSRPKKFGPCRPLPK